MGKMITGLCYDLRSWYLDRGFTAEETAEFDREETVDALEEALESLGYATRRIGNVYQLVEALAAGQRWDLVFNITEGLYGPSRESVVPALLDQYRIPYVFSNGEVLGVSLNKQLAKQVVAARGVMVAPGFVVRDPAELEPHHPVFPLFVKPLSEGTGKGITGQSRVENADQLRSAVERILVENRQPALVEEFLPGREFTVGVTGQGASARAIGAMEIFTGDEAVYSLEVKEHYETLARYAPVEGPMLEACAAVALTAWEALGGVDGGRIDLRCDRRGRLCFIEANPLAGLHPVHSDLPMLARMAGISYRDLIGMIMTSALGRTGHQTGKPLPPFQLPVTIPAKE